MMVYRLILAAMLLSVVAACAGAHPTASVSVARAVRIALLSDPHVSLAQTGDEAAYKARFDRVIVEINDAKVDMVLIVGDLTQSGRPEQIAAFAAQVKRFVAPVKTVFGNHDVGAKKGITGAKPADGVTGERVARLEATLGPSFFAETIAGVRVLGINASLLGSGLTAEARQWDFLERELTSRTNASPTPIIVLSHYPLYIASPDEPGGPYWNIEPTPRARLLSLLDRNGAVCAFLSGHLHHSLSGRTPSGVFLYTTPPISFGLPRDRQAEGWTLLTLTLPAGTIQTDFHSIPRIAINDLTTDTSRSKP